MKRTSIKRSLSRGWKKSSPRSINPRRKMKSKCGSKCFLSPKDLKYPICPVGSCKQDCRGVLSAYRRARQSNRSPSIAKKALSVAKRLGCKWVR